MQRFIAGFVSAFIVLAVVVVVAVKFGWVPAAADQRPSKMESIMAHTSLDATVDREKTLPPYPYASSDAAIDAGAKLYSQHCAMCHGSGSGGPTVLAKGLYIRAPQFAKHNVQDDPEGAIYWKIEHGVRFSPMPSFKEGGLTEEQIWQLVYFVKNVPDRLPTATARAEWNKKPAG